LEGLEIIVIDIRIHRADDNGLVHADALYIVQVGRSQGNGREGIAAAGLDADADRIPQLVMDG